MSWNSWPVLHGCEAHDETSASRNTIKSRDQEDRRMVSECMTHPPFSELQSMADIDNATGSRGSGLKPRHFQSRRSQVIRQAQRETADRDVSPGRCGCRYVLDREKDRFMISV
nr:hypothetical protein CFP56_70098 [Quercus suber]